LLICMLPSCNAALDDYQQGYILHCGVLDLDLNWR
jgi:hypothetical protein